MTQTYRTTKLPVFYFKEIEDYLSASTEFISVSEFIRDAVKEKLRILRQKEISPPFLLAKDIIFNEQTLNHIHQQMECDEQGMLKFVHLQEIVTDSLDMDPLTFLSKFLVHFAKIHPFKDGNKRTSWFAVDIFLRLLNKKLLFQVEKDKETKDEIFIWQNSTNQKSVEEIASFLKKHIIAYPQSTHDLQEECKISLKENNLLLKKLAR